MVLQTRYIVSYILKACDWCTGTLLPLSERPHLAFTPVMCHLLVNADHYTRLKKKKKFGQWDVLNTQKSTELSKQQDFDSGQPQCSKHSGTGLPLSSHSESFIAVLCDILECILGSWKGWHRLS